MDLAITTLFLTFLILSSTTTTKPTAASHDPCASSKADLSIIHVYGKCSPFNPQTKPAPAPAETSSWLNTILNMASKDPQRVAYLSSLVAQTKAKPTSVPVASGQNTLNLGNYIVQARIGTPPQLMYMVLDTSYDIAWVPCSGCAGCSSSKLFSPNTSTSYVTSDCSLPECTQVRGLSCPTTGAGACLFNQSYGGDSSFFATLSHDSLTLGKDVVPNYAFGCISAVSGKSIPPQGLLGLSRGPLSLLSQSGSLYSGVFSYCLPSFRSYYFSGSLILGPVGQPKSIKTTPLLTSPRRPLYYVNFTGISVGTVRVPIAPELLEFNPNTGAGTIIDSGTVITRFVEPIYAALRAEFRNQVTGPFSSLGAFDTCFPASNEEIAPKITFHFQGLDLVLPLENSLIHSSASPLACLTMGAVPNNVNSLNVIANLQQQNLRILFDTANSRLGIARELCN